MVDADQAAVEEHVTASFCTLGIAQAGTGHRRGRAVLAHVRADDHRR